MIVQHDHALEGMLLLHYREELQQPVFAAIDVLEFPELHDESIPFMAFTKCITRLMVAAGVRDFSLQVPFTESLSLPVHSSF